MAFDTLSAVDVTVINVVIQSIARMEVDKLAEAERKQRTLEELTPTGNLNTNSFFKPNGAQKESHCEKPAKKKNHCAIL